MKFHPKFFTYAALALLSAPAAHSAQVEIFDNQTVTLSSLLTAQPALKFSDIKFRGTYQASGTPSAILLVDQSTTFTATAGAFDQQLWVDQSISGPVSGSIKLGSGVTFTVAGNNGATSGGAIRVGYVQNQNVFSLLTADNTASYAFTNNINAQNGGAISSAVSTTTTIQNANFSGNTALLGGAIFNSGTSTTSYGIVNLTNANFTNNIAYGSSSSSTSSYGGGAIYNQTSSRLNITSAKFDGNQAARANTSNPSKSYGGAIWNQGKITASDVEFTNNYAENQGGAIYMLFVSGKAIPTADLTNATFTNNTTNAGSGYQGGAIYNSGGTLTITNGVFTGNGSGDGGATYSIASNTGDTYTDTSFVKNTATRYGGAIYQTGTLSIIVTDNQTATFTGNTANGAANSIYIDTAGTLSINTGANAVLDMRDPYKTSQTGGGVQTTKSGAGTWKLGGATIGSGGQSSITINEGTLYLYGAGEVANPTTANPSALVQAGSINLSGYSSIFGGGTLPSYFLLGAGTTLIAGGNNSITTGSSLGQDSITLAGGSTVRGGTGNTRLSLSSSSVRLGTSAGQAVTFDTGSGNTLTVAAVLSGPGDVVKTGSGTVAFSGISTFAGKINAQSGTLDFSANAQNISNASFTVGLTASTSARIVFNAAQTFSNNSLTLDFGNVSLASLTNGTQFDLFDGLTVDFSSVSVNSQSVVGTFAPAGADTWTYNNGSGVGLTLNKTTGIVSVAVVPEPATYAAIVGLAVLGLALCRRRHS